MPNSDIEEIREIENEGQIEILKKYRLQCLKCLGKLAEKMPISKRYMLNKYLKRGY
jgi:hypothetical protein